MEIKERLFSDEVKKLAPVLGKDTAERLSKAYLIGDETTRKRIVEMLDIIKASVLADPELRDASLLEAPEAMEGEIKAGQLLYGRKNVGALRLDKDSFMTHVGIFGSSGYGKTNLSYLLVKQLAENDVPVIIFDFSKKNYRDLMQTELRDKITIYTVGSNVAPLRFNPLKPPLDVNKTQWAKEFAEIFDHAYWLLGGGRHIVLKALNQLYEESDRPILADLKRRIEFYTGTTSRERNWVSTSLRPLESLCMKETGEIFDLADGVRLSSLFETGRITILEMDSLSTNDKTFFIEIVLQWIRDWLLAHGKREQLEGVIVLEEAHHILNREKSKKIGSETVMDLVFREMRELGLGIIYLDQHPSMVSYPALGNTSTHFYMNLGLDTRYSSDIDDATNMLGLDKEYSEYLRRLPVGHAFVLMRRSGWTKPFNASFPLIEIKKGAIKDSDVAQLMRHKIDPVEEKKIELDSTHLEIINAIGSGKGVFTSQLYKPLKLSGAAFKEKISFLARTGIVGIREVRIEKTKANYYYLTDKGEKMFAEKFGSKTKNGTNGSVDKVLTVFDSLGWKYEKNGDAYRVASDGKEINIKILTERDRGKIEQQTESGFFYVCGSPEIRNMLLQYAAKHANMTNRMKISVALIEDLDTKGFMDFVF